MIKFVKIQVKGRDDKPLFTFGEFDFSVATLRRQLTNIYSLFFTTKSIIPMKRLEKFQRWRNSKSYDMYHKQHRNNNEITN